MLEFCRFCINPKGLGVINPMTDRELQFHSDDQGTVCEICQEVLLSGIFPSREQFDEEFQTFLNTQSKILFAYSGGLDSTVVLIKLVEECKKRNIELTTFTIETGLKGKTTAMNISNVLKYLQLDQSHITLDIARTIQEHSKVLAITKEPMTTLDVYRVCHKKGILPCGKVCNTMIDHAYEQLMMDCGVSELVTGGDTPKKNLSGIYSLSWSKPSGITIVRGGYGFGLSKHLNASFISDNNIPWIHPKCGGYDTDCLVPGVFFSDRLDHKAEQTAEFVIDTYPIILGYLSERVRFGVIDRDDGLRMLTCVDIASDETYQEFINTVNTQNT